MKRFIPIHGILLAIILLPGCRQNIPLFDPQAQPINRIASANEVITEINERLVAARTFGWISQETINQSFSPAIDHATQMVDAAELLIRAGDATSGQAKIEVASAILRSIREQLLALERKNQ